MCCSTTLDLLVLFIYCSWFLLQQLDDWVLCRIYNKKGATERGVRSSPAPPMEGKIRKMDQMPMEGVGEEKPAGVLPVLPKSDHTYFDSSDSFPRMHTSDSSCSEAHAASQKMKCEREVQSEPRWSGWENTVEIPATPSMDALLGIGSDVANNGGFLEFDYPQLSPLYNPCHDPFSFLLKSF